MVVLSTNNTLFHSPLYVPQKYIFNDSQILRAIIGNGLQCGLCVDDFSRRFRDATSVDDFDICFWITRR